MWNIGLEKQNKRITWLNESKNTQSSSQRHSLKLCTVPYSKNRQFGPKGFFSFLFLISFLCIYDWDPGMIYIRCDGTMCTS